MDSRRGHRKQVYNNLYKKYLSYIKKTSAQKIRNRLLRSTNSELSKEIIRLKEEIKKGMLVNSNLKVELQDLTNDGKHLMDNNKGLYNSLASLHDDAIAFEKMVGNFLKKLDPGIKSFDTQNRSMPSLNGQVTKNSKDTLQFPETNYQRYNFKDFIYIQDLSPIMEENAEVKHLIKSSDITRRLGHRAKVPHPEIRSENVEVMRLELNQGAETNVNDCSPLLERGDVSIGMKNVGKQSVIVEEESMPNVSGYNAEELLPSPSTCNELRNTVAEESESMLSSSLPNHSERQNITVFKSESECESVLTVDVIPPSDSENTIYEKDFHSSLFANVFPRRKVINNECSLSPGSVEEEVNEEPNSSNVEKENLSPKVSTTSLKNGLDQSSIVRVRSDTFLKSNLTLNHENISGLVSETSHQEESIIENTCSDVQKDEETISKSRKVSNNCSYIQKNVETVAKARKSSNKVFTDEIARNKSNMEVLSQSIERQSSKKSDTTSKTVQGRKSDVKPLSRSSDRNSVKSSKQSTPVRKSKKQEEDAKKSLRQKKPLNFVESPVKGKTKRKRKAEKAVK